MSKSGSSLRTDPQKNFELACIPPGLDSAPVKISALILLLSCLFVAPPAIAEDGEARDPRNWPTVTRLILDRYELGEQVVTLRVHARPTNYYNCGYRNVRSTYRAFTLLGGPLETLTGYLPIRMGRVLEKLLKKDPWLPITVEVQFEPGKLSELCPDQVKILKWSLDWQYPPGSITPGKPDNTLHPTAEDIASFKQGNLWALLLGKPVKQSKEGPWELIPGEAIELTGGARLSTAFHCMFKRANKTHYALRIHDGTGRFVHAYIPRSAEARKLIDRVALHRDVLLNVKGKPVKQALSHYCGYQLEVSSWKFPKRPRPTEPLIKP
jgi:hypothetical protein